LEPDLQRFQRNPPPNSEHEVVRVQIANVHVAQRERVRCSL